MGALLIVAPYTGAWIEIYLGTLNIQDWGVAPYTGAWIEITEMQTAFEEDGSHPTRVRGLK